MKKKGGQPSEHYHLPPVGMVEDWITAKARNAQVLMNRAKNYVFPYSLRWSFFKQGDRMIIPYTQKG
ncbi:hypothetical protein AYO07_19325 [Escherichia coli]|uniref:hypothetical protein n=1 Tax=Escherichia coli TaxID=562 RepID=UPI0007DC12CF|nr:hypothetical protein [Escherichia coli]OAS02915.1 hypothetical protein AYO07_19325 [Escherichia coli]HAL7501447.1 hypothetical protein [Escherichia coli]